MGAHIVFGYKPDEQIVTSKGVQSDICDYLAKHMSGPKDFIESMYFCSIANIGYCGFEDLSSKELIEVRKHLVNYAPKLIEDCKDNPAGFDAEKFMQELLAMADKRIENRKAKEQNHNE